jgi:hypothetical protein
MWQTDEIQLWVMLYINTNQSSFASTGMILKGFMRHMKNSLYGMQTTICMVQYDWKSEFSNNFWWKSSISNFNIIKKMNGSDGGGST